MNSRHSSTLLTAVQGQTTAPMQAQVAGRVYAVEANALAIETLALHVSAAGGTVSIHTATSHETLAWGYGAWVQGQTALFRQPLLFERTAIASSGAWTADDTLTLVVRLVETPFYHTLVFHFGGADLLLEVAVNVSLESMQPLLLSASSG